MLKRLALFIVSIAFGGTAIFTQTQADQSRDSVTVDVHTVDKKGVQAVIGEIIITELNDGLVFKPVLNGLAPGLHGFHVHETPDCSVTDGEDGRTPAGKAGDHLAPDENSSHGAPWEDESHLGDLPALYVDEHRSASQPLYKPNLDLDQVRGRALIIHQGGDTYSSVQKPLGGGGPRVACGIIPDQ